jgi:hypothetical protein
LFALARRKSERARALFAASATGADPRERIYAAQGLGAAGPDDAGRKALVLLLGDTDWRVACEAALALGKHPFGGAFEALSNATQHASPHVRRCAFEALGSFKDSKLEARFVFERARVDVSPNVRAAAIAAGAKLFGDESAPKLSLAALEKEPQIRIGAANGAAQLSSPLAVPLLVTMSADPDLRVAEAAIEGFEKHPTAEARARLHVLLSSNDNGLRLAAVTTLAEMPASADLAPLRECLAQSKGEIAPEIAAGIMVNASKIGGDDALALLKTGLANDDPYVRKKARTLIAEKYPKVELPRPNGKARAARGRTDSRQGRAAVDDESARRSENQSRRDGVRALPQRNAGARVQLPRARREAPLRRAHIPSRRARLRHPGRRSAR